MQSTSSKHFKSIKQFCFLKDIGVGSFGTVKLAVHTDTNRHYAVKIIDLSKGLSPQQIDILQRQINIHSQLDHPHIIKLWDSLQEDTRIYMVMQLAENSTLFSYQNQHSIISELDAFRFFSQTLSAVNYLHKMDIMHRDLKPQNILLDSHMNVKLCDLGWATDNIEQKRKTFCGTYEYMAPEMVFEQEYNYKIDVWALGVLLYELLHGRAPFPANSLAEIKKTITDGSYELAQDISSDLKHLIVDILQFNPDKRPALQQIAKYAWCDRMKKEVMRNAIKILQESKTKEKDREKHTLAANKKHKKLNSLLNEDTAHLKQTIKPMEQYLSTISIDRPMPLFFDKLNFAEKGKRKLKNKCKTQGEGSMEKLLTDFSKDIFLKKPIHQNFFRQDQVQSYRHFYDKQSKKTKKTTQKFQQLTTKYVDRRKNKMKGVKQNDIV